jgi:hypothetical protein
MAFRKIPGATGFKAEQLPAHVPRTGATVTGERKARHDGCKAASFFIVTPSCAPRNSIMMPYPKPSCLCVGSALAMARSEGAGAGTDEGDVRTGKGLDGLPSSP